MLSVLRFTDSDCDLQNIQRTEDHLFKQIYYLINLLIANVVLLIGKNAHVNQHERLSNVAVRHTLTEKNITFGVVLHFSHRCIMLSVLRFTDSDYLFGIFNLFLNKIKATPYRLITIVMIFTLNVISWRSVLFVDEAGGNHRPVVSQTNTT
jgi:hypothetical protein